MDHLEIDVGLASQMVQSVQSLKQAALWDAGVRTIHRVPSNIRGGDEKAYDPKIISIGPFHRGVERLKPMEAQKWRYLHQLLDSGPGLEANISNCIRAVKSVEVQARRSYSETIGLGDTDFLEMMVLDSCFIIEFLIQRNSDDKDPKNKERKKESGDPIYCVRWVSPLIRHDLLLLENQIPFCVLQVLFDSVVKPNGDPSRPPLLELALNYITHQSKDIPTKIHNTKPYHLLHLLHSFHSSLLSTKTENSGCCHCLVKRLKLVFGLVRISRLDSFKSLHFTEERTPRTIPSASELREAGIRFKNKDGGSFLDVTFRNNVIEMPLLSIGNSTKPVFRNLIAFEQCCPTAIGYFTSYSVLMDDLINTARDVQILEAKGIIENKLGSDEEVAQLFNRLMMEVTFTADSNYYGDVFRRVNEHCGSKWNKWRAKLVREYFSNPWSTLSLLAAIVLLGLTVLQTYYTISAYYHPPPSRS